MGIFVKNGGIIKNTGDINLNANATRGIGIVLEKGSSTNITAHKIHLNGEEQTAVFAIGSTVNIDKDINFAKENQTKSTYLYGRDGSTITVLGGKILTVDGTTTATTKKQLVPEDQNSKSEKKRLYHFCVQTGWEDRHDFLPPTFFQIGRASCRERVSSPV